MKKSLAYRLLTLFFLGVVFHFTFLNTLHCQELITLDARMTQEGVLIGGENHYGRVDLLTPFLEAKKENDRYRRILGLLQESSLLVPPRQGPVVRWHYVSHHGGTLYCTRIEGDTLYEKEFFNTFDLTDPFDTTIDQEPSHYPDTLVVAQRALTPAERDTLRLLLRAMADEDLDGTVGTSGGMHAVMESYEYIVDGEFHHVRSLAPYSVPLLRRLDEWLAQLTKQ